MATRLPLYARRMARVANCHQHNCIPISVWFRRRWICIRCDGVFKQDMSGKTTPAVSSGSLEW